MTARAAIQEILEADPLLEEIGVEAVYPANAVDTPGESLFLIVRWEPTSASFKNVGSDTVSIWAHDTERDYARITQVLERIREVLPEAVHHPGGDGWTLTVAEWLGEGPDLFDGGYGTVTRFAEFKVISRYTPS